MPTFTAMTTLPGQDAANALADAMERLDPAPIGVGTFDLEDGSGIWEVGGYFTERPDETSLLVLTTAFGARPFAVSKLEDRDWVAQVRRELTPVEAGRFIVYGSHDAGNIPGNRIGLEIEAAMAFGTGHHGTTQGCLTAFDDILCKGILPTNVADIGCGTGVLAMAAAASTPASVIASDIDGIAVATARANCRANHLGSRVICVRAPGFTHPELRRRGPYGLIFANILANPLKRLAPEMARHTGPGSLLILSGILNRQATSVESYYRGHGFSRFARREIGEWTTLTLERG
jgi:ribosomal protein L11 methyltransferase